jgi:hypothetical protein
VVKHAGSVYYRIPLRGEVGLTLVASMLDKALDDAAGRSVAAVILEVDSPGGRIGEVETLVSAIVRHKRQMRIVVSVKEALSAAAMTSLAADEIYVQRGAVFGAATAFRLTPEGTPAAIAEKIQSAWRAKGRSFAEYGGHSPLLADAMIDATLPLYLAADGGAAGLSVRPAAGAAMIKLPGKLLTLTATESVRCGLAKGIADGPAELGPLLGFPGWTECEGIGPAWADWVVARIETGDKEWKATIKRFQDVMALADAEDPNAYADYRGASDPDSVRRWNQRATRCAEHLKRAEVMLTQLTILPTQYPHLNADATVIEDLRRVVVEYRVRLEGSRMKVPDGPKPKTTYGR